MMDVSLGDIDLDSIKETVISSVNNPFTKESIESINFTIRKPWFGDKSTLNFDASVDFRKGLTEGSQGFKADDFMSLVAQVDAFLKLL